MTRRQLRFGLVALAIYTTQFVVGIFVIPGTGWDFLLWNLACVAALGVVSWKS